MFSNTLFEKVILDLKHTSSIYGCFEYGQLLMCEKKKNLTPVKNV